MKDRNRAERSILNGVAAAIDSERGVADKRDFMFHAIVISVDDELNSNRVQVRIPAVDDVETQDDNLPWCISLMPSFFHCLPIPGEHVMCFLKNPWTQSKGRYWIGPILTKDETETDEFSTSMENLNLIIRGENSVDKEGRL